MEKRKVAFIIGASGVIGESIANQLSHSNIDLVLGYNKSLESISSLHKSIGTENSSILKIDISSRKSVTSAFNKIYKKYSRLDYLVNVAGYTETIPIDEMYEVSESSIDLMMNINYKGAVWCCIEFIEWIKKNISPEANPKDRCSIINISSNSIKTHNASNIFYISSKAALKSFTESMAINFGRYARFNSVAPGLIKSDMTKARFSKSRDFVKSNTPTNELTTPLDIAITVKMLLLESTSINGQTIYVDGGRTIGG